MGRVISSSGNLSTTLAVLISSCALCITSSFSGKRGCEETSLGEPTVAPTLVLFAGSYRESHQLLEMGNSL